MKSRGRGRLGVRQRDKRWVWCRAYISPGKYITASLIGGCQWYYVAYSRRSSPGGRQLNSLSLDLIERAEH